jgi:predicted nucleotidyltransferase
MKTILEQFFYQQLNITFALLFGSRAKGFNQAESDWDFAIWFENQSDVMLRFLEKEELRQQLANLLKVNTDKVDIVDLQTASLSISSSIVEEGMVLKGDDSLALSLFYKRIWALEEDFYWRLENEICTLSS